MDEIKAEISNLVCTTHFWNQIGKSNNLKVYWGNKTKGTNQYNRTNSLDEFPQKLRMMSASVLNSQFPK